MTGRHGGAAAVLLALGLPWGCGPSTETADLLLINGKVVTVDPQEPEAQAVAVKDDLILAVGTTEEIDRYRGEATEVINLDGRLAVPGFIEGHGHFRGLGRALRIVNLLDIDTWEEGVRRVADAAAQAEPGEWILGRGWHQEKWSARPDPNVEGYPTHHSLSRATPDNPVILTHASGHAAMVNARTMELAGINDATPDPEGGAILRDAYGAVTGLLRETAQSLAGAAHGRARTMAQETLTAEERRELARREIELADRECLVNGITSFQDAGSDFETIDLLRSLYEEGALGVRLWVMIREENEKLAARIADYRMVGVADQHLTVRAIKRSIDGALGSHGAWLLEPYHDLPESSGLNTSSLESLEETARLAIEHDFQLCVHAIGDRGNREALDLFERTFAAHPSKSGLRWRVEHAQHLSAADIPRFARLGVLASMQGIHCTSDAPWVPVRLGPERAEEGAYVWRKLIDSGARVSNGTDVPVEDIDPIASFHASVTRQTADGSRFFPEQVMTRMEALESYTIHAAYAAFEDGIKGSLTPGKLADIVVLSQDILTVDDDRIADTEVEYTIVGGRVMYRRSEP